MSWLSWRFPAKSIRPRVSGATVTAHLGEPGPAGRSRSREIDSALDRSSSMVDGRGAAAAEAR